MWLFGTWVPWVVVVLERVGNGGCCGSCLRSRGSRVFYGWWLPTARVPRAVHRFEGTRLLAIFVFYGDSQDLPL